MSLALSIIVCCTVLAAGAGAASTYATHSEPASTPVDPHAGHVASAAMNPLAARVREVTIMYRDINVAMGAGYSQFGGCVSGPEAGAMGVHFVKGELVDGTLDANEPEALIDEIQTRGQTRVRPGSDPSLTPPLRQLALGRSNKNIAGALDIGEETVKTHVGHVLSKLQVENRAQAIVQALKRGLASLEELDVS